MAPTNVLRFYVKGALYLNFHRRVNPSTFLLKSITYSTSRSEPTENSTPVKFTTTSASKISIDETLNVKKASERLWFQPYVVAGSLSVFLIYFCLLREENDLDEIIGGNPEYRNDYANYIDLKLKLEYCKHNHLPTAGLIAKIEEYETKLSIK